MDDTVVVAAREDNFKKLFLAENLWHSISIARKRIPEIKWIAVYRKEVKAITHIAEVASIEPWPNGKYVLNFAKSAIKIGPIGRGRNGKGSGIQGRRYTSKARLEKAKILEEIF